MRCIGIMVGAAGGGQRRAGGPGAWPLAAVRRRHGGLVAWGLGLLGVLARRLLRHSSCHNGGVDVSGMRRVQARVAALGRDEQAAVSFAVVEVMRPLAELDDPFVAPADAGRLLAGARSASPEVLPRVLAAAEALPGADAGAEPPGQAAV